MLKKLRFHTKKIFIALLILILPSFVLWSVASYLQQRKQEFIYSINGKKISTIEYQDYYNLALLYYRLNADPETFYKKISKDMLDAKALELILLLWKAKQDKIKVSDQEVVNFINSLFPHKGKIEPEIYKRFIQNNFNLSARAFEEYIRKIILADKVIKVNVASTIELNEDKLWQLYNQLNKKIKISVLTMPLTFFKEQISPIKEIEVEKFFEENKNEFKIPNEITVHILVIPQNKQSKPELNQEEFYTPLNSLKNKYPQAKLFTAVLTSVSAPKDIPEWDDKIYEQLLFSPLYKNNVFKTNSYYLIIQKISQRGEKLASFDLIKSTIKEKLYQQRINQKIQEYIKNLAKNIEKGQITFSAQLEKEIPNSSFTEFDFFGRDNLPKELTSLLNSQALEELFSLKPKEILKYPLIADEKVYIIQAQNIQEANKESFEKDKKSFRGQVLYQKFLMKYLSFLAQLEKEAKLKQLGTIKK